MWNSLWKPASHWENGRHDPESPRYTSALTILQLPSLLVSMYINRDLQASGQRGLLLAAFTGASGEEDSTFLVLLLRGDLDRKVLMEGSQGQE